MYSVIVLYVQYMYCTVGREKNCVVESLSAAATMESVVALDVAAAVSDIAPSAVALHIMKRMTSSDIINTICLFSQLEYVHFTYRINGLFVYTLEVLL